MNAPLPVFLTAYDPAELPGGTIDPLGFTAGYLALADLFFPDMTAAANQATYFPMLCAGLWIADSEGKATAGGAAGRKQREQVGLRFERLWALACALSERSGETAETDEERASRTRGLRGIRYVERELDRLAKTGSKETGTELAVLAQQYRYGAFGIYGSVAESLRLIDKTTLAATPGFGAVIGESFLETTTTATIRRELKRAACDASARIRLSTLEAWGELAHAGAKLKGETRSRIREAFLGNSRRRQMLELLEEVFEGWTGEWSDRALLDACVAGLEAADDAGSVLGTALRAASAYDAFLREALLIFERLLWLCRTDEVEPAIVADDAVMVKSAETIAARSRQLLDRVEALMVLGNTDLTRRGRGVVELARYFASGPSVSDSVRRVMHRHAEIQSGKFERGRPKQAWVVERGGRFALTSARFGLRTSEPVSSGDVHAPDWRFGAALSMLDAVDSFDDDGARP